MLVNEDDTEGRYVGRDPGPLPVPVLPAERCYPALEAQGIPQGHESGSFCRRHSIVGGRSTTLARAKSFFSRVELANGRTRSRYIIASINTPTSLSRETVEAPRAF